MLECARHCYLHMSRSAGFSGGGSVVATQKCSSVFVLSFPCERNQLFIYLLFSKYVILRVLKMINLNKTVQFVKHAI